MLRSSFAIQFVSETQADWSPDALPEHTKADILSALEARWCTHLAFAQVETAIFDAIWHAKNVPAYSNLAGSTPAGAYEKRALLRQLTAIGPLAGSRKHTHDVLDWLERSEGELNLFSRGFMEVRQKKSGEFVFLFENGSQRQHLTAEEMRSRAQVLCGALRNARDILQNVGQRLATT